MGKITLGTKEISSPFDFGGKKIVSITRNSDGKLLSFGPPEVEIVAGPGGSTLTAETRTYGGVTGTINFSEFYHVANVENDRYSSPVTPYLFTRYASEVVKTGLFPAHNTYMPARFENNTSCVLSIDWASSSYTKSQKNAFLSHLKISYRWWWNNLDDTVVNIRQYIGAASGSYGKRISDKALDTISDQTGKTITAANSYNQPYSQEGTYNYEEFAYISEFRQDTTSTKTIVALYPYVKSRSRTDSGSISYIADIKLKIK